MTNLQIYTIIAFLDELQEDKEYQLDTHHYFEDDEKQDLEDDIEILKSLIGELKMKGL